MVSVSTQYDSQMSPFLVGLAGHFQDKKAEVSPFLVGLAEAEVSLFLVGLAGHF